MNKNRIFVASLALLAMVSMPLFTAEAHPLRVSTEQNENVAEIKFDTLRVNLGTFKESDGVQSCSFTFTNTGVAPLVIHQAFASCGCTVPSYSKDPVKPGQKGEIKVTYNGAGKFPGRFQKTVTVRSNAKNEIVRLTIEGNMTE